MAEPREDPGTSADGTKDPTGGAGAGPEEPVEFGAGKGPAEADSEGDPQAEPGAGGYAGRDPKEDMPRMPSVPESQEDSMSHDAAPSEDAPERSGSS
jgi:hypothetical protein